VSLCNVLSSISQFANDSFKKNSCEECEAFVEMLVAVLPAELENHEYMKLVIEKIVKLFPTYLMNPANHETFHPQNLCCLRYVYHKVLK